MSTLPDFLLFPPIFPGSSRFSPISLKMKQSNFEKYSKKTQGENIRMYIVYPHKLNPEKEKATYSIKAPKTKSIQANIQASMAVNPSACTS